MNHITNNSPRSSNASQTPTTKQDIPVPDTQMARISKSTSDILSSTATSLTQANVTSKALGKAANQNYKKSENIKAIMLDPANYPRAVKAICVLVAKGILQIISHIGKALSKENSMTKIKNKITLLDKKFTVITANMNHAWGRKKLGDQVIATSVNVGKIDITSEQEEQGIQDCLTELEKDPHLKQILVNNPQIKQNIKTCLTSGVCWASSIQFIESYLIQAELVGKEVGAEGLKLIADESKQGVEIKATAKFGVYKMLWNEQEKIGNPNGTYIVILKKGLNALRAMPTLLGENIDNIKVIDKLIKMNDYLTKNKDKIINKQLTETSIRLHLGDIINDCTKEEKKILNYMIPLLLDDHGFKNQKLSNEGHEIMQKIVDVYKISTQRDLHSKIISTDGHIKEKIGFRTEMNKVVGFYPFYESSKDQIKDIKDLPANAYQFSFATGDGAHACAYIVEPNGDKFIFDPNYGVIDCKADGDPAITMMKVLSLYEPPQGQENKVDPNYKLEFYFYDLVKSAKGEHK